MDELNDFKKLLDDIKDDVSGDKSGSGPSSGVSESGPLMKNGGLFKGPVSDGRRPIDFDKRERGLDADNMLWNENKETVAFGLLASVVLSIIGVISSIDYLILVGAIGALLFIILIFLLMFSYSSSFRKSSPVDMNMRRKIEELSEKVDSLSVGNSGYSQEQFSLPDSKVQEMDGKIEELRVIIKSLIRVVENGR